jgi:hypothetical protein
LKGVEKKMCVEGGEKNSVNWLSKHDDEQLILFIVVVCPYHPPPSFVHTPPPLLQQRMKEGEGAEKGEKSEAVCASRNNKEMRVYTQ